MEVSLTEIANLLQFPELIAFSVFIVGFVIVLAVNVKLFLKNRKLYSEMLQLGLDRAMLLEKIEKLAPASSQIEQTEGFVKFLSQSRDWAFEYIEGVQSALQDFELAMISKNDEKIENALNNLKSFLPDNEEENNKINKEKNEN
jgi:hypothetical protein